jgi:hypothetical protein
MSASHQQRVNTPGIAERLLAIVDVAAAQATGSLGSSADEASHVT